MRLDKIILLNDEGLGTGRFTVIVGGNGVGKSTLLRETFHKLTQGQERQYRWLKEVVVNELEPAKAAKLLLDSLDEQIDRNNLVTTYQSRGARNYQGAADTSGRFDVNNYKQLQNIAEGKDTTKLADLPVFRKPFFAFLGSEFRLTIPHEVGLTPLDQPAADALNVLWRKEEMRKRLQERVRQEFSMDLVLLDHRGTQLEIGLADEQAPDLEAEKDRQRRFRKVEEWKGKHGFTPLNEAGHGIRAMTNLLLSMFEPVNQVILIDEPELHLYPTQKRNLARHLVELAKSERKQTLVVTHDATFLQGVLDTAADATILRLNYGENRKNRHIRRCEIKKDGEFGPTKNQREYLNALFYERVILVEGAGDRAFYQGIAELAQLGVGSDVGIVVSGGKGGTLNIAKLCQDVGVPYVYVFDFDVLLPDDLGIIDKAVSIKGGEWDYKQTLNAIEEATASVENALGGEAGSRHKRALKELKAKGVDASGLRQESKQAIQQVIQALRAKGIYVIGKGELETWCPEMAEEKARFAERALAHIEKNRGKNSPLWPA